MADPDLQSSAEFVRLAHFSDIHLTAKPLGWRLRDLATKRTTGWMNLKMGRGRRFYAAEQIVTAMMADIRAGGCHVVFSGDATTMGFESEYATAARCLGVGTADMLPGLAVPGNHDLYTRSAVRSGFFERYFAPWQNGERVDASVYPFAQRVGHCWLIAVNSARSNFLLWDARGEVDRAQSDRLRKLFRALSPGPRILVTHYPLYLADGSPEDRWRLMRRWPEFRSLVIEGKICLWLHGHRHDGYVLPATAEQPFPDHMRGIGNANGPLVLQRIRDDRIAIGNGPADMGCRRETLYRCGDAQVGIARLEFSPEGGLMLSPEADRRMPVNRLEIRGSSGAVWVEALEPAPDDAIAPGEILLQVDVSSGGFTGRMFPCVRASDLRGFAVALGGLHSRRFGDAVLPGLTENFVLRVAWEERDCGRHLAATGRITSYAADGAPHANELRFGLDFLEAALAGLVTAAQAMVEERVAPEISDSNDGS